MPRASLLLLAAYVEPLLPRLRRVLPPPRAAPDTPRVARAVMRVDKIRHYTTPLRDTPLLRRFAIDFRRYASAAASRLCYAHITPAAFINNNTEHNSQYTECCRHAASEGRGFDATMPSRHYLYARRCYAAAAYTMPMFDDAVCRCRCHMPMLRSMLRHVAAYFALMSIRLRLSYFRRFRCFSPPRLRLMLKALSITLPAPLVYDARRASDVLPLCQHIR